MDSEIFYLRDISQHFREQIWEFGGEILPLNNSEIDTGDIVFITQSHGRAKAKGNKSDIV